MLNIYRMYLLNKGLKIEDKEYLKSLKKRSEWMNGLKENVDIKNLIYEVRGKQVMLDSDLAVLYGCKNGTKEMN